MLRPSPGRVTNPFSPSHRAMDFGHGNGSNVIAAHSGTVKVDRTPGYGLRVSVVGELYVTRYAHLSWATSKKTVVAGQRIGVQGDSGSFAQFVHLHFEVLQRVGSGLAKVNPTSFISSPAGTPGTPITSDLEHVMGKILFNTDDPNDGTRRAFVGETVFQPLSAIAAAEERQVWGDPVNVSGAEFAKFRARAEARGAQNVPAPVTLTPAQLAAISAGVKVDLSAVSSALSEVFAAITESLLNMPAAIGTYTLNLLKQQWTK